MIRVENTILLEMTNVFLLEDKPVSFEGQNNYRGNDLSFGSYNSSSGKHHSSLKNKTRFFPDKRMKKQGPSSKQVQKQACAGSPISRANWFYKNHVSFRRISENDKQKETACRRVFYLCLPV